RSGSRSSRWWRWRPPTPRAAGPVQEGVARAVLLLLVHPPPCRGKRDEARAEEETRRGLGDNGDPGLLVSGRVGATPGDGAAVIGDRSSTDTPTRQVESVVVDQNILQLTQPVHFVPNVTPDDYDGAISGTIVGLNAGTNLGRRPPNHPARRRAPAERLVAAAISGPRAAAALPVPSPSRIVYQTNKSHQATTRVA